MRNVEGSCSGRREIIPDENLYLYKEMKSTTNRKYVTIKYFPLISWFLKNHLNQNSNNVFGVYNV